MVPIRANRLLEKLLDWGGVVYLPDIQPPDGRDGVLKRARHIGHLVRGHLMERDDGCTESIRTDARDSWGFSVEIPIESFVQINPCLHRRGSDQFISPIRIQRFQMRSCHYARIADEDAVHGGLREHDCGSPVGETSTKVTDRIPNIVWDGRVEVLQD